MLFSPCFPTAEPGTAAKRPEVSSSSYHHMDSSTVSLSASSSTSSAMCYGTIDEEDEYEDVEELLDGSEREDAMEACERLGANGDKDATSVAPPPRRSSLLDYVDPTRNPTLMVDVEKCRRYIYVAVIVSTMVVILFGVVRGPSDSLGGKGVRGAQG